MAIAAIVNSVQFSSVQFSYVLHPYIGQVQPLDVACNVEAVKSRLSVVVMPDFLPFLRSNSWYTVHK